jgi:lysozyme family protein
MAIYRARYWNLIWGDRLAAGIDLAVMDGAVHSGPARAVRWLQFAAGATPDGVMGPLTLAAQAAVRAEATIANMTLIRRRWLQRLDAWAIFGRGWSRRLRRTEARALELSRANPARDGTAVVVGTGPAASKAPDAQETARDIGVDPAVLPWWAALAIALAATLAIAWWHRAFIAERLARARDFIADLRAASRETVAHELCGVTIFQAFADLRARIAAEARAIPDQEAGSGGAATSTREE